MKIQTIALLGLICVATLSARETADAGTNSSVTLTAKLLIDPKGPVRTFSRNFAGLMTEEINHSYDGGLYGELIRNRSLLDNPTTPEGWKLQVPQNTEASMSVSRDNSLTDKLTSSLHVTVTRVAPGHPVSVSNEGYWGIPVRPATTYQVTLYAKGNNTWSSSWNGKSKDTNAPLPLFRSPLTVSLESGDHSKVFASAKTPPLDGTWRKITLSLKTADGITPSKENVFSIGADAPGVFDLTLVSLFPPTFKNRLNGNRIDLMERLARLHPRFLRFPGGNFVEGDNLSERYDWKQTRGPLEFRPGHNGCWKYRSSDGLGLLEFMGWCEDLGMEPVLAVFAGYSIKQQPVPAGPLLEPYVQDALDEIEYLTGDAGTTHWGAIRAKDGHPAPFTLKFLEVGNEDQFDKSNSYDGRYAQFHDAIRAKYPDLRLIATMPVKNRKPDLIDDHFYKTTDWFVKEFNHYDKLDRSGPRIFVGEWATMEKPAWKAGGDKRPNTPTLHEALGDAAWMCAMERNADLIEMQCYAPLLSNENPGGTQWKPNLIGFDAISSYVSPSWHAQEMFNTHRGDEVLTASVEKDDPANPLPYSVTRDRAKGLIHIKLVNVSSSPREVTLDLGKETEVASKADVFTLTSEDPSAVNSLQNPDVVKPVAKTIGHASRKFSLTLQPSSLTLITLNAK